MEDFRWTESSTRAAYLVAQGNLSYPEIASAVDVTRQTIHNWRKHPEFTARVKSHGEEIREEICRIGLADMHCRVHALNDRWNQLRRIIEDRADDPSMANVPGGSTGLLVRTTKTLGSGDSMMVVDEYAVDTALLRELREHEKQAAQELGQWSEKSESKVEAAGMPKIRIVEVHAIGRKVEEAAEQDSGLALHRA